MRSVEVKRVEERVGVEVGREIGTDVELATMVDVLTSEVGISVLIGMTSLG